MNVEIKSLPAMQIAAVSYPKGVTPGVHDPASGSGFDQLGAWLGSRDLFTAETRCIGIFHPSASTTHPYEAAFTVPRHVTEGEGAITIRELPAATYAVVHISIANDSPGAMSKAILAMHQAGRYALDTWLPNSSYRSAELPALELYLTPPQAPTIEIDLYLPVEAK